MEIEIIEIPRIELRWSEWHHWNDIIEDARSGGIKIPNGVSGVYEVKYLDSEERLTIGKASDLRMRVRQGLIKGKTKHSSGDKIRANEDVSTLLVRWAESERPAATEEELHRRYVEKHSKWPKYTDHT